MQGYRTYKQAPEKQQQTLSCVFLYAVNTWCLSPKRVLGLTTFLNFVIGTVRYILARGHLTQRVRRSRRCCVRKYNIYSVMLSIIHTFDSTAFNKILHRATPYRVGYLSVRHFLQTKSTILGNAKYIRFYPWIKH